MTTTPSANSPGAALKQLGFRFPFRKKGQGGVGSSADFTDEHDFHEALKREPRGSYSVSGKGLWHGGIHVTEAGAGGLFDLQHGVRSMFHGEVVALRFDSAYPITEMPAENGKPGYSAPYSTGFVLVRHTMEFPRGTTLTFFSLYIHLQDMAGYQRDASQPRPAFLSMDFKVTSCAQDKPHAGVNGRDAPVGQQGLNIRANPKQGKILGILPQGSHVSIGKRDGEWGQLQDTHGAELIASTVGGHVVDYAVKGWIFLGTENGGSVVEESFPESSLDCVVVPSAPIPIQAGDLIGHLGQYDSLSERTSNRMVHIEVFCDDSIKSFIEQGRAWDNENGAYPDRLEQLGLPGNPTILRIDKNTKLFKAPGQEGKDAPQTAVIVANSLAEMARRAENQYIETAAGTDGQKANWWKVDSADVHHHDISGWVREQNFVGGSVTREFAQQWVDFQVLTGAHDPTHTMFATVKGFVDYVSDADVPKSGALDKLSPLMKSIYRALIPTGDGRTAANDLCVAGEDPWIAIRMSRLIVKHESEWANPAKWKQFYAAIERYMGPRAQHEAEQARIKKLVWWDEVKAKVADLPSPDVFHVHPIGLVGNFISGKFQFTLAMMRHMFPLAGGAILQEVMSELNAHIAFYKLDTELRRNHFFAQVIQEVGPALSIHSENLNYSQAALDRGLFSYFRSRPLEAQLYGNNSRHQADAEAIGNRVYANRGGNGGVASGDGFRYRGRGMIQLTYRGNYQQLTKWHRRNAAHWLQDKHMDFENNPNAVGEVKYAVRSACYFWMTKNLYTLAETRLAETAVDDISKVINPGLFKGKPTTEKTGSINGRRDNFQAVKIWGGLN